MLRAFLAAATAWMAVAASAVLVALPYWLRDESRASKKMRLQPYLRRLRPHYWLGYALIALSFTHASALMGPAMARADRTGIWAATIAFCLLLLQLALGLYLQNWTTSRRKEARSTHFLSMLLFMLLLVTHLWKNG